ncbi:MAG: DUF2225 domain-containing protein [Defluviitaleaceae bacterium]|nr:DUF2225 domain-containing protein [Defluviitaleaceae bacterium]MCL2263013.1 DUF2225 domain-containing protein [Defluviitaleaceae bacterium]
MVNIFASLSSLGITEVPDAGEITADERVKKARPDSESAKAKELPIMDYVYLKSHKCPVCSHDFHDVTMRTGKCRFIESDTDLRAHYKPYDPMLYNIIMCQFCGYAAMTAHFNQMRDSQREAVIKTLAPQFKYKEYPLELDATHAKERYLMALLCATLKKTRSSERAMLCLRLSWFADMEEDEEAAKTFRIYARKGFELAYSNENFPVYGMDSLTLCYLLGELCRRTGERDSALRYISQVIMTKTAGKRLKEKAAHVRELIKNKEPI